ncbi:hypothetical protein EQM14_00045 [Caproiciproducens sp. NJN-50]|uniref:hypothetical protein n=1 Tax=Acutalibacteraceae TaxID=3082771 RepID=UPI000FFDFAF7|nr:MULTISPECIES: hypothetical protein [Acutalibacteraceae]QAT48292.1 hypothetical protein EQM14_00045 [Caproiciproducens sp. NJN-50]
MTSRSTENEKNSKPPEPEDSGPPQPDFQESKLVPDESEAYEEQQTGIELSYVLKKEEVYECLRYSSRLHRNRKTFVLAMSGSAALAVLFLAAGAFTYRGFYYFCAALCAAVIIVLGVFPYRKNVLRAREAADGNTVRMTVYPDRIEVDQEGGLWEIPMDGTAGFVQIKDLFVLYAAEKMLMIPVRCIKPRILPDVQAMIVAGTRPKKLKL